MQTEAERIAAGLTEPMRDMIVAVATWPSDGGFNDLCRMDLDARTMAALDRRSLLTPEFDVSLTDIGRAVAEAIRAQEGGDAL